jgi:hypothetical protein
MRLLIGCSRLAQWGQVTPQPNRCLRHERTRGWRDLRVPAWWEHRLVDEVGRNGVKWIDRLLAHTGERVNVQLSVEQGLTFPVEVFAEHGPAFVGPGTLGLSQQLEHDLIDWLSWWQGRSARSCRGGVTRAVARSRTISQRAEALGE